LINSEGRSKKDDDYDDEYYDEIEESEGDKKDILKDNTVGAAPKIDQEQFEKESGKGYSTSEEVIIIEEDEEEDDSQSLEMIDTSIVDPHSRNNVGPRGGLDSKDQTQRIVADEIIHPNATQSLHGSLGEDEEYVLIEEEEEEELDGDITVPPERRMVEMTTATPI
jgi:hypothetical protein